MTIIEHTAFCEILNEKYMQMKYPLPLKALRILAPRKDTQELRNQTRVGHLQPVTFRRVDLLCRCCCKEEKVPSMLITSLNYSDFCLSLFFKKICFFNLGTFLQAGNVINSFLAFFYAIKFSRTVMLNPCFRVTI